MSSIVLLVGQCGNQVGHELMRLIDKSDAHPLSHRDGKLRCVCVDSESKVIRHNYREDTRSSQLYREGNMINGQRGRGNNWALGYHGLSGETKDTSLLHRAMEIVRKEVERCDNYAGTIVVHSLTGGTGSGLGSHLTETLRDTYPLAHVMSVAVSPHSSGDSPLQHYNSLLSLSSLQHHADAVLLFSNDDILHHIATHTGLLSRQNPSGSISIKDMNYYISMSLAGVLQPLGSKPKRIKGKFKEKGGNEMISGKKRKEILHKSTETSFKMDTITKQLSFSLSESQHESEATRHRAVFGRSPGSASSVLSNDSVLSTSSYSSYTDSLIDMSRQPRSTASALLRYRGILNPSGTRNSKSDSRQTENSSLAVDVPSGNEPWEMFRSICSEPSKKFATVHHIAKSKVSWESLTQSLIHSVRRYDRNGMQFSTLSSLLVARGDHDGSFAEIWPKIEDKLRTSLGFVDWNPFPIDFWISVHKSSEYILDVLMALLNRNKRERKGQYNPVDLKDSQSLTLCLNSTKIVETLEDVIRKTRAMYDAGAYLHWFSKYGCSKNDFLDAFETLESVVEEYNLGVK